MTIYVDDLYDYGRKGKRCHMWADSVEELDEFAQTRLYIKLRRKHISKGFYLKKFVHYDLYSNEREAAIQFGAVVIKLRHYIKLFSAKMKEKERESKN